MKLLSIACLAVLLGVSSANEQMQINYYTDSGCSDYLGDVDVTWATYVDDSGAHGSNCYNYNYGNSVSIANCYEDFCQCIFYPQANCQGDEYSLDSGSCLTDASAFYSFACYYS